MFNNLIQAYINAFTISTHGGRELRYFIGPQYSSA
jgi:hypothetical protein